MTRIPTALAIVMCVSTVAASDQRQSKEWASKEVVQFQNLGIAEVTTNALTPGREEEVFQELRKRNDISLLLRLKDEKTINETIEKFAAVKGKHSGLRRALEKSCAPWLLDELGPLLYEEDTFYPRRWNEGGDSHSDFGFSMSVAQIMAVIIANSPEIPADAKSSAGAIRGVSANHLDVGLLGMMRSWWEHNADAVRTERYLDVAPPTFDDFPPPSDASEELITSNAPPMEEAAGGSEPTPPDASATSQSVSNTVMAVKVGNEPGGKSASSSRWMFLVLALLIVSFVVALSVAKSRRRNATDSMRSKSGVQV